MFDLIHPEFQKIYEGKIVRGKQLDGRNMKYSSKEELIEAWDRDISTLTTDFERKVFGDAKCHEIGKVPHLFWSKMYYCLCIIVHVGFLSAS